MKTKTFDCVEMKRRAADKIYEEIKDKSVAEQVVYWREATEQLKRDREYRRQAKLTKR